MRWSGEETGQAGQGDQAARKLLSSSRVEMMGTPLEVDFESDSWGKKGEQMMRGSWRRSFSNIVHRKVKCKRKNRFEGKIRWHSDVSACIQAE